MVREVQEDGGLIMSKSISLDPVEFSMLTELAKRNNRQKPEQYLKNLIRTQYDALKR